MRGLLAAGLAGCANNPYLMPESEPGPGAPGEAMVDMSLRKAMPNRPPRPGSEFFFKHCAVAGAQTEFTVNAYECTSP